MGTLKYFNYNFYIKEFFSILILLTFSFIPVLDFLNNNSENLIYILHDNILINIILYFLIIISFYIVLKLITKEEGKKISLFIGISIWILFQHSWIKYFFYKNFSKLKFFPNLASESALIFIIISIFIFYFLNKKKFFNAFFIFFLFFNFFDQSLKFFNNYKSINEKITNDKKVFFSKKVGEQNIYFFILDAMKPLDEFEEFYKIKLTKFKEFYKDKNYEYFYNTKNNGISTEQSLTFMFNLDNKSSFDFYKHKNNLKFPKVLSTNNSKLLNKLSRLGYDFKWIGNIYADCSRYNYRFCLSGKKENFLDIYLIKSFLKKTPILQIVNIIFSDDNLNKLSLDIREDTAIEKLKKYLLENQKNIKNNSTFYFIHQMHPHWPYNFDENCKYRKYNGNTNFEGYKKSYLCTIKMTEEIINVIDKVDPDSFVIIQSDHNWEMSLAPYKYNDRKSIFNLVKNNHECNEKITKGLNNVSITNYILHCIEK